MYVRLSVNHAFVKLDNLLFSFKDWIMDIFEVVECNLDIHSDEVKTL